MVQASDSAWPAGGLSKHTFNFVGATTRTTGGLPGLFQVGMSMFRSFFGQMIKFFFCPKNLLYRVTFINLFSKPLTRKKNKSFVLILSYWNFKTISFCFLYLFIIFIIVERMSKFPAMIILIIQGLQNEQDEKPPSPVFQFFKLPSRHKTLTLQPKVST